jgi:hypothetical protein
MSVAGTRAFRPATLTITFIVADFRAAAVTNHFNLHSAATAALQTAIATKLGRIFFLNLFGLSHCKH